MDLAWLRTFQAIHRTGSLTRAAKALGMTQPAVSQHLRGLELAVGASLFARLPRGVTPTAAGDELAGLVADHLDALGAIAERFNKLDPERPSTVYIGGQVDVLASWVIRVLAQLPRQGVRVVARPGIAADVATALERGEIDLAFTDGPYSDRSYESERLNEYDVVLVADAARVKKLEKLDEDERAAVIAQGPFVSFNEEMPVLRRLLRGVVGKAALARPSIIIPDGRGMAEAVAAGGGYAALPQALVADRIQRGGIGVIPYPGRALRARLWAVVRRSAANAPRIAVVLETLREGAARADRGERAPRHGGEGS